MVKFFLRFFIELLGIPFIDVIGIDATYNVCKEKVALVIFTGVNNLGQTIILMGSFITKEDFDAYQFALLSFEGFFGIPSTVMTDQDPALKSAIESQWKETNHLFCLFHIFRNIQKNMAKHLGKHNEKFLKDFTKIQRIEDSQEFEKEWGSFIEQFSNAKMKKERKEGSYELEIVASKSDCSEFESSFDEIDEECEEESKEEQKSKNEKIKNYLLYLSKSRHSWAKCYTYKIFGAGLFFFKSCIYF